MIDEVACMGALPRREKWWCTEKELQIGQVSKDRHPALVYGWPPAPSPFLAQAWLEGSGTENAGEAFPNLSKKYEYLY